MSREFHIYGHHWLLPGVVALVLIAFGIVGRIDFEVQQAAEAWNHEAMQRLAAARELERGLRGCPQHGPGMTETLVMVIHLTADSGPTVTRCIRFAERPYTPRRRP